MKAYTQTTRNQQIHKYIEKTKPTMQKDPRGMQNGSYCWNINSIVAKINNDKALHRSRSARKPLKTIAKQQ